MIELICKETKQDKKSGKWYIKGSKYEFDNKRAKELMKSGYFEYGTRSKTTEDAQGERAEIAKSEKTAKVENDSNENSDSSIKSGRSSEKKDK